MMYDFCGARSAAGDQVDPATHWMCLLRQPGSTWPNWPAMRRAQAPLRGWTSPGGWSREAADELAGAYAEACELAGRVEDAFPAWVEAADSAGDPPTRARRLPAAPASPGTWGGSPTPAASSTPRITRWWVSRRAPNVDVEEDPDTVRRPGRSRGARGRYRAAGGTGANGRLPSVPGRDAVWTHGPRLPDRSLCRRVGHRRRALASPHDQESPLIGEAMLRPLTAVHPGWGDLASARAVLAEGLHMAHQIGVPAIETFQSTLLATADMLAGDWETALRRTFDAHDLAQRVGFAGSDLPAGYGSHASFVLVASTRPLTVSARDNGFEMVCGRPACSPSLISPRAWSR